MFRVTSKRIETELHNLQISKGEKWSKKSQKRRKKQNIKIVVPKKATFYIYFFIFYTHIISAHTCLIYLF